MINPERDVERERERAGREAKYGRGARYTPWTGSFACGETGRERERLYVNYEEKIGG